MTDGPQDNVANLTLMHLRRIEATQTRMMEILLRHDTKLGRLERDMNEFKLDVDRQFGELKRDIAELKSDHILLENRALNRENEILAVMQRLQEHEERLQQLERPMEGE